MDRRAFIGALGAVALGGAGYELRRLTRGQSTSQGTIGAASATSVPDESEPFITPSDSFYRIDTVLGSVPHISAKDWSLKIHGMVDRSVVVTMADLAAMNQVEHVITLGCVSNPVGGNEIGTARWGGVLLSDVLARAGVKSEAEQLVTRSQDGWTCGTPVSAVMDGRPAMLATHMNGEPLPAKHGFPVRMVVPGLFGYVSATKWVVDMELTTWDAFDAYWVSNGWAQQAPMLASSRIDSPRTGARLAAGQKVRIGGFAWAPRSGVARVQVRVDGGAWNDAIIGEHDTGDAWAQWSWEWSPARGAHVLEVRCIDAQGQAQDETVRPEIPSGATGLHSVRVKVL